MIHMTLILLLKTASMTDEQNTLEHGGSKNVYIRRNEKLPSSHDFNDFFKNKKNKIHLKEFLKNEFAAMVSGESVKMLYSVQSD